jgi:hypothetical protein
VQDEIPEDLNERAADDQVLFDMGIQPPWSMATPLGDEVPGDPRSGPTSVLMISRHREFQRPPATPLART